MFCHVLLFALLQGPTETSGDAVAAPVGELPGVLVERVPLTELRERLAGKEFVPVPRSQLQDLLRNARSTTPASSGSCRL